MKIFRFVAPLLLLAASAFGQVNLTQAPGTYTDKSIPRRLGTANKTEGTTVLVTDTNGLLVPGAITNSTLTSTRVPFASTAGLIVDSAALTFNSGTGALSATSFAGAVTGNASTATALANIRTIGGSNFDGTANVTSFPIPGAIGGTTPAAGTFTTLTPTTSLTLTSGTAPTTTVGQIAFDTNAWATSFGAAQVHNGTANTFLVGTTATDTPTNGQVPTWNTGGGITWETPSSGSGTVTVVSSGSLTSTALVTGGGTTTLQTPSATATMDSSGNISTPGTLTVGNAATTAGAIALTQGTTQSTGTTNITIQAPAAVTSYIRTLPGAVGSTGFLLETVSGSVQTESLVAGIGTGSVVRASETVHSITFVVSGGGSALTTGVQDVIVNSPYGGTCIGWSITTSAADTITFDILRSTYVSGAAPSVSIVGAGTKPALASNVSIYSTTFTSWTSTAITALDNFKIQITAVGGTCTAATFTLYFQ